MPANARKNLIEDEDVELYADEFGIPEELEDDEDAETAESSHATRRGRDEVSTFEDFEREESTRRRSALEDEWAQNAWDDYMAGRAQEADSFDFDPWSDR